MSNSFINVKEIARQALPRLIENLVFPNLCYRDYSNDYQVGKGATVQVRKPVVLTASDFVAASGTTAQAVQEQTVDVTLDKLATVDVEFGAIENAVSVDDLNRLFIAPAAAALAEKINDDGLSLFADVYNYVGTAGTTPDGLDDFANAARKLNISKAPMTERYGVWDPAANAAFQQLPALVNAEKAGSNAALRAGAIGRVFGIDNYMCQGVKNAAAASGAGTIKINNASGYDAGATSVKLDGITTAIAVGDQLGIGGRIYVVRTATALSEAGGQTIALTYGLKDAVADNDDVTPIGAHTANMVFHRNAFAFVTRPLTTPAGVESYTTSYNGITMRVTRGYDMKYKKDMLSMDVLYGYKTVYPELAVRVLG